MKKLKTNSEVAHAFAYKTYESAGTNNFYFTPDQQGNLTIYSYGTHFPIAKFAKDRKGYEVLLFTMSGYSNSTAKHVYLVKNATSHIPKVYMPSITMNEVEVRNYFIRELVDIVKHLSKARKCGHWLSELEMIKLKVSKYYDFLGKTIPSSILELVNMPEDNEEMKAYLVKSKIKEDESLIRRIENQKKASEIRAEQFKKDIIKWHSFNINSLKNITDFSYLRLNQVTETVETSQGVKIPANNAYQFYTTVMNAKESGKIKGLLCNKYLLSYVDDIYIRVGCHKITFIEIDIIMDQLKPFIKVKLQNTL